MLMLTTHVSVVVSIGRSQPDAGARARKQICGSKGVVWVSHAPQVDRANSTDPPHKPNVC